MKLSDYWRLLYRCEHLQSIIQDDTIARAEHIMALKDKLKTSAHKAAAEVADRVLDGIPELIHLAMEKRRKEAAWFLVYRRARLASCRPIMRPFWRWLVKKSKAAVLANKETAYLASLGNV
jgi:hypothetical protein